ncbi:MAG: membrane oxidoreductase [Acidimicrobiales bacterium]|nr:MAG: membrane oxidoreductase [Acidimicrobiales bacterium]
MKLENEFRVSVPIDRAWEVLTDIPLITPCLPGAALTDHDDTEYKGKVKIKVGPVTADYSGSAVFVTRDEATHHVEISASGRDSRGSGNASATIAADMTTDGDGTKVSITTDLKISGKVAQFGKGMIAEVSAKLIDQFVDCIEQELLGEAIIDAVAAESAAAPGAAAPTRPRPQQAETLDLMEYAGNSVYKRLIPVVAVIAVLIALRLMLKRR